MMSDFVVKLRLSLDNKALYIKLSEEMKLIKTK